MTYSQRQLRLLKLLFSNRDLWTTEGLAHRLGVTSRTIKNDIAMIRDQSQNDGFTIDSIRGKGVYVKITDS